MKNITVVKNSVGGLKINQKQLNKNFSVRAKVHRDKGGETIRDMENEVRILHIIVVGILQDPRKMEGKI